MKHVTYNTTSPFKVAELEALLDEDFGGVPLREQVQFSLSTEFLQEDLTVDIAAMVTAEALRAYSSLRIPVIVEHAGLVFSDFAADSYPGGLTKPMWNTLADRFIEETNSANRAVTARACVGYCDGTRTHVFTGETVGHIATEPRGSRAFYWDTIFIPDDDNPEGLTYAEIVDVHGLAAKVRISQSAKALREFFKYRLVADPQLWEVRR